MINMYSFCMNLYMKIFLFCKPVNVIFVLIFIDLIQIYCVLIYNFIRMITPALFNFEYPLI